MAHSREVTKDHKMKFVENLTAIGAATELCEFLADVLQCESDIMHITGKYLVEINDQLANNLKIDELVGILQKIYKSILSWKERIDDLEMRKADLPQNLDVDKSKLGQVHTFKAICSLETSKTSLKEGEDVEITDSSHPNFIKVRNADGKEGYLPLLSCFIPSPDFHLNTCTESLRVQLLTCSSDLIIKLQSSLTQNLLAAFGEFISYADQTLDTPMTRSSIDKFKERSAPILEGLKVGKLQLKSLARSLRNLENKFIRNSLEDMEDVRKKIANMDKAILFFLALTDKLLAYRADMKTNCRPIRIAQLDANTLNLHKDKNLRYYEVRLTANETTIREERTYFPPKKDSSKENFLLLKKSTNKTGPSSSKQCSVQSVIDPRTGEEISIREAVATGILDHQSSQYINLETGERIPMSAAIRKGLIKMSRRNLTASKEFDENANVIKNSSLLDMNCADSFNFNNHNMSSFLPSENLVTLKTKVMKSEYEITYALDRASGNRVEASEADDLGIIKGGQFHDTKDGSVISFDEAIQLGWLGVEQHNPNNDVDKLHDGCEVTFAVETIYDRSTGTYIGFLEAVKRHLIDPSTSCVIDTVTNEKICPKEAMERGLIRACMIETPPSMQVCKGSSINRYPASSVHRYLRTIQSETSSGYHPKN